MFINILSNTLKYEIVRCLPILLPIAPIAKILQFCLGIYLMNCLLNFL